MTRRLAEVAATAAASKTLEPTTLLEVGDLIAITDYFVITSGRNDRQVRAIVDEVSKKLRAAGSPPPRQTEGLDDATWVLLDYGEFVVHVFSNEAREFYGLERLWADAPQVSVSAALSSNAATS